MMRLILAVAAAVLLSIPGHPAMSQAHSGQQSPRIEMPDEPAPAVSEAATAPRRHRVRRERSIGSTAGVDRSHVDRSAANAFTRQLNRQVLESLQSGGAVAPAGNPPYPAPVYPPR